MLLAYDLLLLVSHGVPFCCIKELASMLSVNQQSRTQLIEATKVTAISKLEENHD